MNYPSYADAIFGRPGHAGAGTFAPAVEKLRAYAATLTPEQRATSEVVMHLSHAEEALAGGDFDRAGAHLRAAEPMIDRAIGAGTGHKCTAESAASIARQIDPAWTYWFSMKPDENLRCGPIETRQHDVVTPLGPKRIEARYQCGMLLLRCPYTGEQFIFYMAEARDASAAGHPSEAGRLRQAATRVGYGDGYQFSADDQARITSGQKATIDAANGKVDLLDSSNPGPLVHVISAGLTLSAAVGCVPCPAYAAAIEGLYLAAEAAAPELYTVGLLDTPRGVHVDPPMDVSEWPQPDNAPLATPQRVLWQLYAKSLTDLFDGRDYLASIGLCQAFANVWNSAVPGNATLDFLVPSESLASSLPNTDDFRSRFGSAPTYSEQLGATWVPFSMLAKTKLNDGAVPASLGGGGGGPPLHVDPGSIVRVGERPPTGLSTAATVGIAVAAPVVAVGATIGIVALVHGVSVSAAADIVWSATKSGVRWAGDSLKDVRLPGV